MNENIDEVQKMTDHQADTSRNDLIDLMIEKARRLITNEDQLETLVQEYQALKK